MSPEKLTVILVIAIFAGAEGISRDKRSPHKKHKIIVINDDQQTETGGGAGWGAPPPPPAEQETIVEHHHHWEAGPPPPPPPPSHSHSVRIEINKGGKGKLEEDLNKFKKFKEDVDSVIEQIDDDKKASVDAFKEDVEGKLDALAKIPHLIASDIDFFGRKIAEDLEKKKKKEGGLSIQVWKGKGDSGSGSGETVHHHHYYHDSVEQRPPPPPPPTRPPQTLPPPRPPTKQYYGWGGGQGQVSGGDGLEHLYKFVDAGAHFMDFLGTGGGSQYNRRPVSDEGSAAFESGEGWGQGQRGKGFGVSVFKSKGFRRRK